MLWCIRKPLSTFQTRSRVGAKSILRSILSTFTQVEQPREPHRERGQRRRFLKHALASSFEKGRAAWRHDIGEQILTNVKRCVSCARETTSVGSHLDLIVDGANAVDSFVVRSKKSHAHA